MQPSDPLVQRWRLISPSLILAAVLAAALALGFAPRAALQPLRDGWREALRPGLVALGGTTNWLSSRWAEFRCGDAKLPEAERKIEVLSDQLRTLQMQLLLARSRSGARPTRSVRPIELTLSRVRIPRIRRLFCFRKRLPPVFWAGRRKCFCRRANCSTSVNRRE